MTKLNSTKPRSLRLQKKLHVGAYTSLFSEFEITFSHAAISEDASFDRHDLIADVLHWFGGGYCFSSSHEIIYSGGVDWYARLGNNLHVEIADKLLAIDGVVKVRISEPVDAWHYDFEIEDLIDLPTSITIS